MPSTAWRPIVPLRLCLCLLLGLPGPAATDRPERPTGRFDQEPPKVLSLAITPTIIDVRQTAKMLETSVRVTDDFSGVAKVELEVAAVEQRTANRILIESLTHLSASEPHLAPALEKKMAEAGIQPPNEDADLDDGDDGDEFE